MARHMHACVLKHPLKPFTQDSSEEIFIRRFFFVMEISIVFIFLNLLAFSSINPYLILNLLEKWQWGSHHFFSPMFQAFVSPTPICLASFLTCLSFQMHTSPRTGSIFWNLLSPWLSMEVKSEARGTEECKDSFSTTKGKQVNSSLRAVWKCNPDTRWLLSRERWGRN